MPARPRRIEAGDTLPAEYLRAIARAIVQRITGVPPIRVAHTGTSISISTSQRSVGSRVILAKVTGYQDDYLECTRYVPGETSAGEAIEVAKPYMLRRTPFDGESITYQNGQVVSYTYTDGRTRTADDGVDSETQHPTPDYFVGEILTCLSGPTGVTFIKTIDGADETVGVLYSDLNTCGRFWAKAPV